MRATALVPPELGELADDDLGAPLQRARPAAPQYCPGRTEWIFGVGGATFATTFRLEVTAVTD